MDSALDFESSGCGFESHQGRALFCPTIGYRASNLSVYHLSNIPTLTPTTLEPFGVIRKNWNDTEKISMAPAQG